MRVKLSKRRHLIGQFWQEAGWVIQVGDDDGAALVGSGVAIQVPDDTPCMQNPSLWIGCTPLPQAPAAENKIAHPAALKGGSKHASTP